MDYLPFKFGNFYGIFQGLPSSITDMLFHDCYYSFKVRNATSIGPRRWRAWLDDLKCLQRKLPSACINSGGVGRSSGSAPTSTMLLDT